MARGKKNGAPTPVLEEDFYDAAKAERAAATIELATETLTGDMRDFILNKLRYEQDKRPWDKRSESDQRDTIASVEQHCHDVVRRAVEMIAAGGLRSINAHLEQITVKDAIVGKVVMAKHDEQRHVFMDAVNHPILIIVADPDEFTGERAPAEVRPDQGDLVEAAMVVHSAPNGVSDTPFTH